MNMILNGAISSMLPDIFTVTQDKLSNVIEDFALPHVNSALNDGLTLKNFISPPKTNEIFEKKC
jgi:hypothetical protein